ncbi:hypothetical protein SD70_23960 [Gordoniibacillus kamchatkensis]|uniref:DUF3231 family protein n=1 Tax=Gordoniibacillus kamchatkensis TaxID=1590651 RepID=A0ABR5ADR6_9BACL|nr:DUF3231 family protein [Paenibacillus sp. VKM B-2647]KIL38838.1 hypothetical protein SD70_23960 [Paenibacillus sp. VKM B-2647]
MVNVLETAIDTIKSITTQDEDQPLHIGEAMGCWTYLKGLELAKTSVQIGINSTTDHELKTLLEEDLKLGTSQRKRLHEFMLREGLTLPKAPEELPNSDPTRIPFGAKFTDEIIATDLSLKIVSLIVAAAANAADAVRTDVCAMFIQFQAEKLAFAARLKQSMRKRGWIDVPPFYIPPGAQEQPS